MKANVDIILRTAQKCSVKGIGLILQVNHLTIMKKAVAVEVISAFPKLKHMQELCREWFI